MRIRSLSDLATTAIAWFPILAVIVCFIAALVVGAMHLETFTHGTSVFIPDHGAPATSGGAGGSPAHPADDIVGVG